MLHNEPIDAISPGVEKTKNTHNWVLLFFEAPFKSGHTRVNTRHIYLKRMSN